MRLSGAAIGRLLGAAGCGVALIAYLLWQIAHRGLSTYNADIYPFDDADEWRYTACSRLVEHGYALFSQVFSAQPPLLFLSLAQGMRIFGDSMSGARWVIVLFGVVALLATAWLTWLLAGPVAAGAASLLLAASPGFLVYSRAVEAEIPMMAMVTLSLALAVAYRSLGWRWLPIAAGLALAAAILLKLFALEALVPALWVLLWPSRDRRTLRAAMAFLAAALVPPALEMAVVSPQEQWRQVVSLHNAAAGLTLPGALPAWRVLVDFVTLDSGLTLLAVAGVVTLAVLQVWDDFVFLVLWLGGTAIMLLLFRPLFPHHPVILLSSMAVSGGIAITIWVEQLRSRRWLAALPLTLVVATCLVLAPRLAHDDRHAVVPGAPALSASLARYVADRTTPADFVAVDDLAVADLANRLVPPGLCDPSTVRVEAGYLTATDLIDQTRRYRAAIVLPSRGTFVQVPGYMAWVKRHFSPRPAPEAVTAYVRR